MFAGGVGRIFQEFDSFLQTSPVNANKKKKPKKQYNLVENFLDETSCLLNIDRTEYEAGNLPWSMIFHTRMLSAQTLLSMDHFTSYKQVFENYLEAFEGKKKYAKKKAHYIINARNLLTYLHLHEVDPDSVFIGLTPSKTISERFEEWLSKPCDHEKETKNLPIELRDDPLSLKLFKFPGKRGDIVVVRLSLDQITDADLRNQVVAFGSNTDNELEPGLNVFGRVRDAVEFNKTTFIDVYLAPKEESKVSIQMSKVLPLRYLIPPGVSWRGNVQQMRDMVADPYDEFLFLIKLKMMEKFDELMKPYQVDIKFVNQAIKQQPISILHYHILRNAAPIIERVVNANDNEMMNLKQICINSWEEIAKIELQNFIESINEQDGSSNKLFMPTCEQDLMRLNRLNFKTIATDFLRNPRQYTVNPLIV